MEKKQYSLFMPELTLLLLTIGTVYLSDLNQLLFFWLNRLSEITGSFLWANLTILGDALVSSVFVLLFIRKRPQLVWAALVAALLATVFVHTLKPLFDLPRPPAVLGNSSIIIIGPAYHHRSFPSGHTATIFTLAGVLAAFVRNYWQQTGFYIIALLVGISRIVVGVHWPGDVLTGAAIGFFSAAIGFGVVSHFGWSANRTSQLITGGLLLIATLTLLISHNTHYPQAFWLQKLIALVVLIFGGGDFVKLLRGIESGNGKEKSWN